MKSRPLFSMPWYKAVNNKLEGEPEWVVSAALVVIAVISFWLIFHGDRVMRTAWLVYLLSP